MNYTSFDQNGRINGNWPLALYPPSEEGARHPAVPVDAIELPDDEAAKLLEYPDAWRLIGGKIVPFTPPPPPLTEETFGMAIRNYLDARASERGYDSIQSAATYRQDPNPAYAAEGQAAFEWRSAVWTYATAELEKVKNGQRPAPTVEAFLAELPKLTWPA